MSHTVIVVPYDPGWAAAYRNEARRLRAGLTAEIAALYHIGSTSVPGLAAKPIIDVLMEVADMRALDTRVQEMESLGYVAMGEYGIPGRRYFRRSMNGRRSHHVHAYPAGHAQVRRHLAVRDFLHRHPAAAHRYGEIKTGLAQRHSGDMATYIAGKQPFVDALEQEALAWADATHHDPAIRAVLFDADGVVQTMSPRWRASLASLCGEAEHSEAFLADVFAAEQPCLTGAGDFPSALQAVLRRWGSNATVEEALAVWTRIEPHPEILGLIARLRQSGLCTALATNQQPHRAGYMTRELGYGHRFDHLFFSCELGAAKPAAAYFTAVLDGLAMTPRQVLFLDDHEVNVEAARTVGLNAAVFHLDAGAAALERLLRTHGVVTP